MSKLRNVQFYRNSSPVANVASHSVARSNAQTAFDGQIASMQDGEMLLYRYTITGDDTVHTITGVVRKNGNTGYVEILANADMLSSAAFSGAAADVTYDNSDSELTATNVQAAIDEVEGRVDTLEQGVQSLNAVMGVIVDTTELTKDANGKVTIDTDDDHAYNGSTNPLATVETVTSAVSALNTVIGNEFTALNGVAGIASVNTNTGIVTLKNGVMQTNGKIANNSESDITLAKVAYTGDYEDLENTPTYDDGSAVIATLNTTTGVVTLKAGVEQNDLTIANNSESDITLAAVATTGAAADVSIADAAGKFTADNVEAALLELKTDIASVVGGMRYNGGVNSTTAPVNGSTGDIRPGDVYLATGAFTIGSNPGTSVEAGDMIVYMGTTSSSPVTLDGTNCNVIERETDTMVTAGNTLTNDYVVFGNGNKEITTTSDDSYTITATQLNDAITAAGSALQSISQGTDGDYVTTTVGSKDSNNDQSVAVSLTYGVLNSTLGVTTEGVLNTDNVDEIKAYIDAQAASSGATVSEGDAIDVTETTDSQTGIKNYEIDVLVSANAVQGTSTTPSSAANLLVINSNNELAVSDTWDCGTY